MPTVEELLGKESKDMKRRGPQRNFIPEMIVGGSTLSSLGKFTRKPENL